MGLTATMAKGIRLPLRLMPIDPLCVVKWGTAEFEDSASCLQKISRWRSVSVCGTYLKAVKPSSLITVIASQHDYAIKPGWIYRCGP